MKVKRIVLHRRRGRARIDDRAMFKGFQAWNSFITHPDALRGWEKRILAGLGVMEG
jgi:hypothetical protein